jgi:hypothetical protein
VPGRYRRSGVRALWSGSITSSCARFSALTLICGPVSDFLSDPSPERGAQGSAVSVWVPSGAPPAKLHPAQRGLLPHRGRPREEKTAERQARPRGRPAPAVRRTGGDAVRCRHIRYLTMVVSLIERRRVSEQEIRKMLARAVRQHRIARRRRIDYLLHYLTNTSS